MSKNTLNSAGYWTRPIRLRYPPYDQPWMPTLSLIIEWFWKLYLCHHCIGRDPSQSYGSLSSSITITIIRIRINILTITSITITVTTTSVITLRDRGSQWRMRASATPPPGRSAPPGPAWGELVYTMSPNNNSDYDETGWTSWLRQCNVTRQQIWSETGWPNLGELVLFKKPEESWFCLKSPGWSISIE